MSERQPPEHTPQDPQDLEGLEVSVFGPLPTPETDSVVAILARALRAEADLAETVIAAPSDAGLAAILARTKSPEQQPQGPAPSTLDTSYQDTQPLFARDTLRSLSWQGADDPAEAASAAAQSHDTGSIPIITTAPFGPAQPGSAPIRSRRRAAWVTPVLVAAAVLALAVLSPLVSRLLPIRDQADGSDPAAPPTATAPLPVYYVLEQGGERRLVREFRPTTLSDPSQRAQEAVRLAVQGTAIDPDYTSLWRESGAVPGADDVTVIVDPQAIRITISQPGLDTPDAANTSLSEQQLVWTATAAAGRTLPAAITWTASPLTTPSTQRTTTVQRRYGVGVRAPIWVNSVSDAQRLRGGTVRISGDVASTATGTLRWTLTRLDGAAGSGGTSTGSVVAVGEITDLGAVADQRREWTVTFTMAEPGSYVFAVSDDTWTDTKRLLIG